MMNHYYELIDGPATQYTVACGDRIRQIFNPIQWHVAALSSCGYVVQLGARSTQDLRSSSSQRHEKSWRTWVIRDRVGEPDEVLDAGAERLIADCSAGVRGHYRAAYLGAKAAQLLSLLPLEALELVIDGEGETGLCELRLNPNSGVVQEVRPSLPPSQGRVRVKAVGEVKIFSECELVAALAVGAGWGLGLRSAYGQGMIRGTSYVSEDEARAALVATEAGMQAAGRADQAALQAAYAAMPHKGSYFNFALTGAMLWEQVHRHSLLADRRVDPRHATVMTSLRSQQAGAIVTQEDWNSHEASIMKHLRK